MTTVSDTASAARMALDQANSATSNAAQSIQDQFLKLLVTQLRNQDPLNPMQNAELTTQLAQISTVEGINNLRNTIMAISGQIDVGQSMDAVGLIGKGVLIPGNKVALGTNPEDGTEREATPFGIDLQGDAAKVSVKILDENGTVVRTIELPEGQKTGVISMEWDGKTDDGQPAADGRYSVEVLAQDVDGKKVIAEALTYGVVKSVAYTVDGLRLDLGLAGQASIVDIRKVLTPGAAA